MATSASASGVLSRLPAAELVASLCQQGRLAEAESALLEAIAAQPAELPLHVEYARLAQDAHDWPAAEARWRAVQSAFPAAPHGFIGLALAAHEQQRARHARHASAPVPSAPVHDLARQAEVRRDWPEAERLWREAMAAGPAVWWMHIGLANALRGQGSIAAIETLRAAQKAFPSEPAVFSLGAQWAAQDGRLADAAALWADFRARFATHPDGYVHGARMLFALNDADGALSILRLGTAILPENLELLIANADAPSRRNDNVESLGLWRELAAAQPGRSDIAVGLAEALERCGRTTEALATLEEGLLIDPTSHRALLLAMLFAYREKGAAAGLRAAKRLQDAYPDEERSYIVAADALADSGQVESALASMLHARQRLPNAFGVLQALIRLAATHRAADPQRLTEILSSVPPTPRHCASILAGLRHAGALQEAHAFIATLNAPVIESRDVLPEATRIALDVGDFDRAVALGEQLTFIAEFADDAHLLIGLAHRRKADWHAAHRSLIGRAALLPSSVQFWCLLLEASVNAGQTDEAINHWRALRISNRMSPKQISETAYALLASSPPDDLVNEAIDVMLSEADDGSLEWVPVIARVAELINPRFGPNLPRAIKARARTLDTDDNRLSASIFRSISGRRLSDTVLSSVIADCARQGRIGLLSCVLRSQNRRYCKPIVDVYLSRLLAAAAPGDIAALEMHAALHLAAIYSYSRFAALLSCAADMTPSDTTILPADLSSPLGLVTHAAKAFQQLASPAIIESRARRLRVAVCVSGQLRGYEDAFQSWSALHLEDVQPDIYVHTWREVGYKWSRLLQESMLKDYPVLLRFVEDPEQGPVFLKKYYPKVFSSMTSLIADNSVVTEPRLTAFYGARNVVLEDDPKMVDPTNANIWKLHTKIERCHGLARATNEHYDLIVRIRPDLKFGHGASMDWDRLAFDCHSKNIVYTDDPHAFSGEMIRIGDQFAVARPDIMDKYADLASTYEAAKLSGVYRFQTPRSLLMHRSIAVHLIQNGIVARRLDTFVHGGFATFKIRPQDVIEPLLADIAERPRVQFDDDFLRACGVLNRQNAEDASSLLEGGDNQASPEIFLERGVQAEARADWPDAERCWRAFLALEPRPCWAHAKLAVALRQQGRIADGEAVLLAAIDDQPEEVPLHIEYARFADHQRDWPKAEARWRTVCTDFPDATHAYFGLAHVLREQQRRDEAQKVLEQVVARFPRDAGPLHELGRMAQERRDWEAAESLWRRSIAIDPNVWWAHTSLAQALIEQGQTGAADDVLAEQFTRFADEPALFIIHARLAERADNWPEAERRWTAIAERFPALLEGYLGQARALRVQERHDDARPILNELINLFPDALGPRHELAILAELKRDWAAAERCWRALIAIDAKHWWGHTGLATALREQDRIDEAEAALLAAHDADPGQPSCVLDYILIGEQRRGIEEALRRGREGLRHFPNDAAIAEAAARILLKAGNAKEADEMLAALVERLPNDPAVLTRYVQLAVRQRDWSAARSRALLLTRRLPDWGPGHAQHVAVLRGQGALLEAREVLTTNLDRFPANPELLIQGSELAQTEGDWAAAAKHWAVLSSLFPDSEEYKVRWSDAYLQVAIDLYDAGNCSEAATLILAGPEQVRFLVEAAKQVVIWKMPELGLELGRRIMTRWPNDPNGPFRVAGMLRELGRAEEAEVVLRDAPERWRNEPDILSIWASLPMHWHDWNQALERWTMLIERFPDLGKFPAMKARCLRIAGRIEEAEGVLRRAEVDFPADEDCRIVRAELEMAMSR